MCRYIHFLNFDIPSYGLFLCLAIFITSFFIFQKSRNTGIQTDDLIIISAFSIGTAIISGTFMYIIITYPLNEIIKYISSGDFSFISNLGIIFYGGLTGGILGAVFSAKKLHINIIELEKSVVPYLPLGHAIGRIGCITAGCCYGFKYDGFLSVNNIYAGGNRFPIQAVEILFNLIIMYVLLRISDKKLYKYALLSAYLEMYSVMRFFLEFFRADAVRGIFFGISTSQWFSLAILLICSIFNAVYRLKHES